MNCLIRFALVWTCLAAAAAARDIVVSNTAGDDRRDGRVAAITGSTGAIDC